MKTTREGQGNIAENLENSVLFDRRVNGCGRVLLYRVNMVAVREEHRCGYTLISESRNGQTIEHSEVRDITSDIDTATRIFDLVITNGVYPCHLRDVVEDYLSS